MTIEQRGAWEQPAVIQDRGPFKVIEREVKHDRFGMQLIADIIIRPDGSLGEQFWIDFPRQAVLIFPLDDEGNLYMTREYTYATDEYSLEVAGGSPDNDESLEEAARREVKEELGIEVESIAQIGTYKAITSRVNNKSHLFLAKVKGVGKQNLEAGEVIRLEKVSFGEAYGQVLNGDISDPTVAVGILRIKVFLEALQKNPRFFSA